VCILDPKLFLYNNEIPWGLSYCFSFVYKTTGANMPATFDGYLSAAEIAIFDSSDTLLAMADFAYLFLVSVCMFVPCYFATAAMEKRLNHDFFSELKLLIMNSLMVSKGVCFEYGS